MGHQVTIEGSRTTPSDALGRGERRTVEVTDDIRQLVRIGAVIVVEGSLKAEYARGGPVTGPAAGEDSVPALLSPGYVIPVQDHPVVAPVAPDADPQEPDDEQAEHVAVVHTDATESPAKRRRSSRKTPPAPPAEDPVSGES